VMVDLAGPGWRALNGNDFVNVNCKPETWNWKGSLLACTGQPTGVMRTRQIFTNFELIVEWRHLRSAGNSGVFLGEVRLWVNQHEVSGGNACEPRKGYLCLESEGSPIEFKNIAIRELP